MAPRGRHAGRFSGGRAAGAGRRGRARHRLVSYIQALYVASVAKVVFIISCSPFFAALFAWLLLREAVRPGFWLALGAALLGIALMAGGIGLALILIGAALLFINRPATFEVTLDSEGG